MMPVSRLNNIRAHDVTKKKRWNIHVPKVILIMAFASILCVYNNINVYRLLFFQSEQVGQSQRLMMGGDIPKVRPKSNAVESENGTSYQASASSPLTARYSNFTDHYLKATILPGYESRVSAPIEEAYVSFFFGSKYVDLIEVVIDSANTFSNRPIIVYVAGESMEEILSMVPTTWKDQFPHLILYFMPKSPMHAWFDKLRAILLSNVKRGIIVEADTLITPMANKYFDILKQLPPASLTVLAPQHSSLMPPPRYEGHKGHNDNINRPGCPFPGVPEACGGQFPYPMEKREGQYRHAHIMWTDRSKFLFESMLNKCLGDKSYLCSSDEAALNVAMWESGLPVNELCLMDPNHRYWTNMYVQEIPKGYPEHIRKSMQQQAAVSMQSRFGPRTIAFTLMHGCKDSKQASHYLTMLKKMYGSTWEEAQEKDQHVPWILHNGSMHTTKEVNFATTGLSKDECLLLPS